MFLVGLFTKQGWRKAAETKPSGTLAGHGLIYLAALKPYEQKKSSMSHLLISIQREISGSESVDR